MSVNSCLLYHWLAHFKLDIFSYLLWFSDCLWPWPIDVPTIMISWLTFKIKNIYQIYLFTDATFWSNANINIYIARFVITTFLQGIGLMARQSETLLKLVKRFEWHSIHTSQKPLCILESFCIVAIDVYNSVGPGRGLVPYIYK